MNLNLAPAMVDNASKAGENGRERSPSGLTSRLFIVSAVVALLPIVVAAGRAIHRGWLPMSDNAFFAIRARDVFSDHPPFVGLASSASLTSGSNLNHPGPLLFDVLAAPIRLFGGGAGLALGIAFVNAAALIGIALVAYRRGGALLGTAAMAVSAGLAWTMGSELLFDPWQPHSLLLPFLLFLMLVWSLTCGDLAALPWAVLVGSFVLQTHLSYGYLVPTLGAWGGLMLVLDLRRRRHDPGAWPARRRMARRSFGVSGLVFIACWVQPVVEQFTSAGEGNLALLVRSTRHAPTAPLGYGLGAQLLTSVVALPPWWFRPSFRDAWTRGAGYVAPGAADVPSGGLVVIGLTALAAVLALCVWDGHRRGDREVTMLAATAVVALPVGLVTAARIPTRPFGIALHQFRWLWPLAAFVFFAVITAALRRVAQRPVGSMSFVAVLVAVAAAFAVLNLPTSYQAVSSPSAFAPAIPGVRDLGRQMGSLEREGPLLVDDLFHRKFANPYDAPVLAELQRRGIRFVVRDAVLVRQLGPARRFTGRNARAELLERSGDATMVAPPGARLAALHEGISGHEQSELSKLKIQIAEYIRERPGLRLNSRGLEARRRGDVSTAVALGGAVDPEALFASRELVRMIQGGFLALDERWVRRFERYAELQDRWDNETVALFVGRFDRRPTQT